MLRRMHWFLWLSVVACHWGLASLGFWTTASDVMPSANYTVSDDVTDSPNDVTEIFVSDGNAPSDTSLSANLTETNLGQWNNSSTDNTTVGSFIGEDIETTVSSLSKQDENVDSKESGTPEGPPIPTTSLVNSTVKPFTYEASETASAFEASYPPKSLSQKQSSGETPASPSTSLRADVHVTSGSLNENLQDIVTPTSEVTERISSSRVPTLAVTHNVGTSVSPVPDDKNHLLDTVLPSNIPSTNALPTTSTSPIGISTSENRHGIARLTTVPLTTPEFWTSGTKATKSTSYSQQVSEEITTTPEDADEVEDETESEEQTVYERSLRTRRVINHAALWITIGFVVVLVSYITVLVIYNRMRPEWQDPQHPYSRFENESDDFPDSNENNMDCENQGLTEDDNTPRDRRDFSQCVDPQDFPPCEGSHEYLLYEDPTVMDDNACEDFTYRDEY